VRIWQKVTVSAIGLVVIGILLPWGDVRRALVALDPSIWPLVLLGFVAGHGAGVFKWRLFISTGRAMLRPIEAVRCYSAGLFANLCLPSIVGGDVLRMAMAGRLSGEPEGALWGGILDRLTDVLALILLIIAGSMATQQSLPEAQARLLGGGLLLAASLGAATLYLIGRTPLSRWPRRLRRPVARSLIAVRRLSRRPGVAVLGLILSLSIQGSFVLLNAQLGAAIGIDVPLAVWFLAWPLAKFAGLLPISLGGLAVREASLAGVLSPFGVPFSMGVLTSLLWQTVLIAGGLMGGATWFLLTSRDQQGGLIPTLFPRRKHG
jgi:uncharacterized membrane protein YbhN (UPF0104 family)